MAVQLRGHKRPVTMDDQGLRRTGEQVKEDVFQQRLARISQDREDRSREAAPMRQAERSFLAIPATLIAAAAIGALTLFLARYLGYHLALGAMMDNRAEFMLLTDIAIATAAGLFIKGVLHLRAPYYRVVQTLGALAVAGLLHNAVHVMPAPFAVLFSQDWVDNVVETTEVNTLNYAGLSMPLTRDGTSNRRDGIPRRIQMNNG